MKTSSAESFKFLGAPRIEFEFYGVKRGLEMELVISKRLVTLLVGLTLKFDVCGVWRLLFNVTSQ